MAKKTSTKQDWDTVADKEFAEMNPTYQADWIDLRHRLGL
jgi:hypothetical protein